MAKARLSRYKDLIETLKPESCVVGKSVRVHACEEEKERRSLITMDSARNLRPRIPWGGSHRCHDAYEVHAATLWGIHTCVTVVHTDCTSGQRFPLAALRKRSSVHGKTSRRSQVCAVHSAWSTATSTRPVRPLGSAPTTPALVPATSYRRPCCRPNVCSMSASRYRMSKTTMKAACAARWENRQASLVSRGTEAAAVPREVSIVTREARRAGNKP